MMAMLLKMGFDVAGGVVGMFSEKNKASIQEKAVRIENMGRSWTDEYLVLYWFGPDMLGWFNPEWARAIKETQTIDPEILGIQVAITVAVFGLGKIAAVAKDK